MNDAVNHPFSTASALLPWRPLCSGDRMRALYSGRCPLPQTAPIRGGRFRRSGAPGDPQFDRGGRGRRASVGSL